jgi:anti-anti-sigma factor
MTIEQLATMTTDTSDGTVIARLTGELDSSNAKHLGDTIIAAGPDARACVVDLTLVTYLDSAALTMLHRLAQSAVLHLVMPPDSRAARLVEIGGLDTVLRTHQTVEDALAAL